MMTTTVTIPEPLKVILDDIVKNNPEFPHRSALVIRLLWDSVKEKYGLKIEGDYASIET